MQSSTENRKGEEGQHIRKGLLASTTPASLRLSRDDNEKICEGSGEKNSINTGSTIHYVSTLENGNKESTTTSSSSDKKSDDKNTRTYLHLLRTNKNFRYFWLSYVVNRMGDWMSYLASISLIQKVTNNSSHSDNNTLISILILVKLLPNVVFMPVGGILADSYDRRNVQIALDVASSGVLGIFLWSYYRQSVPICYLANFLLEVVGGLYLPSNNAIVPQLVGNNPNNTEEENDEELKKGTTLIGLTWSLMAALGSSLGGVLVAAFGIEGCFVIDSVTYLLSAIILYYGVEGNYNVTTSSKNTSLSDVERWRRSSLSCSNEENEVVIDADCAPTGETTILLPEKQRGSRDESREEDQQQKDATNDDSNSASSLTMYVRGLRFLLVQEPLVGTYALLKGSAAWAYGAADVLNVAFSARGSETNLSLTSLKLGILFGSIGVGCIIGSILTDVLSSLSRPKRIVKLCLMGYVSMSIGLFQMALFPNFFASICISGVVRSMGASVIWINSTLLVQKFTPPGLLGRVNSIETGVALLGEALSALGAGLLMDYMGISPEGLSLILAAVALCWFLIWSPLAFRSPKIPQ
uniref:Major facilitator superfamily (MFS) profile domain-containing protein n=1 Tax=Pseudo-nitzschia australis TaxID=44445 RepID=A0A7S4ER63_9STRA|eukprot:CAMPEP_0168164136 /NCGR_PEP_ID=MMETSP0139_2-20121125/767_1 /TAXON_ID=44445 /ORGANISM="Pseudo-nitzschia australis, Strain 10249 10 AB" /LENGTH=581 /DNA_ID=CAMNT_0008081115 /DNA_START=13 /DNA_END=1758 /DNA_ORIENTATION=+